MRSTDHQIQLIRRLAVRVAGKPCRVRVFGSRIDDTALGGALDLMLELPEPVENPALMAAQRAAAVSRAMRGRKVDALLCAPISSACPFTRSHSRKGSCCDLRTQDTPSISGQSGAQGVSAPRHHGPRRIFGNLFTVEQAAHLEGDSDLAERVEAFVGRFGRLQDTLGDKLSPLLLAALGEKHPRSSTIPTAPNV
ncbi:hypothetical protein [Methylococcus capsulatus]|jgi:hypothetical protein|uniref:hypothetical protein n=1 Tax=Methylococcus capsulatus TaxID=414 RepID=UPI00211B43B7|nr:hypothetical protein [Methylococcus capsulatus]